MDAKGIQYESLFADADEAGKELAVKHNVLTVPVLIVNDGKEDKLIRDFSEIMTFINKQ